MNSEFIIPTSTSDASIILLNEAYVLFHISMELFKNNLVWNEPGRVTKNMERPSVTTA